MRVAGSGAGLALFGTDHLSPGIGALAPLIGYSGVIALLAPMGLAGALSGLRLPDVERARAGRPRPRPGTPCNLLPGRAGANIVRDRQTGTIGIATRFAPTNAPCR